MGVGSGMTEAAGNVAMFSVGFWGEDGWFYPQEDTDVWPVAVTVLLRLTRENPSTVFGVGRVEDDGRVIDAMGLDDLAWFSDDGDQLRCVIDRPPVRVYWEGIEPSFISTGCPVPMPHGPPGAMCPWEVGQ